MPALPGVAKQDDTRSGFSGGGRFAIEGEVLGLVVLDSVEEGVVVGGAFGGNLPQQKVNMT
jgi:hypothetical protein